MTMSVNRLLNYVYYWTIERVKDKTEFDMWLATPLPGSVSRAQTPSRADLESEGSEFMAFMGQMTK